LSATGTPHESWQRHLNHALNALNPFIAVAVPGATIVTDAVYVQFTAGGRHASDCAPRTGAGCGICSAPSR
jgi:hypothetical protein